MRHPLRLLALVSGVLLAGCVSEQESTAVAELAVMGGRVAEAGEAKRRVALEAYDAEARRLSATVRQLDAERKLLLATAGDLATRPTFSYADVKAALDDMAAKAAAADGDWAAKLKEFEGDPSFEQMQKMAAALERWARTKVKDAQAAETIKGAVTK